MVKSEMPPELATILEFLSDIKPLNQLDYDDLLYAAKNVTISYHRKGSDDQILDLDNPTLFIVRAGVFDVRDQEGDLLDRVTEGGFFGFVSLLTGSSKGHTLSVYEDGLLYRIEKDVFQTLRSRSEVFDQFFANAFEQRLRVGLRSREENRALATKIADIMSGHFHSVEPHITITDAAKKMTELKIASIGVVDEAGKLAGIFTDKDCRTRVIANGVDPTLPISEVMTPDPITIDAEQFVHEATIMMSRHQIKHLPVVEGTKLAGMVTLSDLIRLQRSDPVLIINDIHRANTVDELVNISNQIPELLLQLIKLDIRAADLGRILTSVTSSLTRRLLALAQEQLGEPPCPFVWLAFGSQGRQDQSAKSDQDNGLLIANEVQPEHDEYFLALANFVNDGLDACGYIYCPGDVMARNSQWRLPLKGWQKVFSDWIETPTPKGLMLASIFFDLRAIYASPGAEDLFPDLQNSILNAAAGNSIFLHMMTVNALNLRPPIGFFRQLIIDQKGEHKDTFDIKLRGMMPLTDIARIHALANNVTAVNTRERFRALIECGALTEQEGNNLLDAHEYIAHQRLLHQGEQLGQGKDADNHLNPAQFSSLTVRQLKDAFKVVRNAQSGLGLRYSRGLG